VDNYTMMQFFEWYIPADQTLWQKLEHEAMHLSSLGISAVWIPPCSKGTSITDVGYGIYDRYDLGEFDQKGTVATKYGTRDELLAAISALHQCGVGVYADIVMNHLAGADQTQDITVVEVDRMNREHDISSPFCISAWTSFSYPGRKGKYSAFQWSWEHFTATDWDENAKRSGIFRICGDFKHFSENVDHELGNYDYLMYADVDYNHPAVVAETLSWGKWMCDELALDGIRLDAVKHINEDFIELFVKTMKEYVGRPFFAVAEYWKDDLSCLRKYLDSENFFMTLFDVPLHYNFQEAGLRGKDYDLRTIFDGSLVRSNPMNVVTFVDNHDSQRHQSLESYVSSWFKPLAYALILLRKDGYPCLFYGDYYGVLGDDPMPDHRSEIDPLMLARKIAAYGEQIDSFDQQNVISWQRMGDQDHPFSGLAVLLSNNDDACKELSFGTAMASSVWMDITGNITCRVTLSAEGKGKFLVQGSSVSVWVRQQVFQTAKKG